MSMARRVIARLTSDIDSITELLSTGLNDLIANLLYLVGIVAFSLRLSGEAERPMGAARQAATGT